MTQTRCKNSFVYKGLSPKSSYIVHALAGTCLYIVLSYCFYLQKINLDILQENIIALSEVMDLKCDPVGLVEGHVIESRTDTGRGYVA